MKVVSESDHDMYACMYLLRSWCAVSLLDHADRY